MTQDERIRVWSYWDGTDRPPLVEECLASWRRKLDPGKFKIVILSKATLGEYLPSGWLDQVPGFDDLHPANQSDYIRLCLLKLYGGVWMDPSTYLVRDLSFIPTFERFFALRFRFLDYETVQNWFLVAPQGDETITKWLSLHTKVLRGTVRLRHRSWRPSLYRGLGLRLLVTLDRKFERYFQAYETYAYLYRNDETVRRNTPKLGQYGIRATYRGDNFRKLLTIVALFQLVLFIERIAVSIPSLRLDKVSFHIRKSIVRRGAQKQDPSIRLFWKDMLVFYKLHSGDRDLLKDGFRFEEEADEK